MSEDEPEQARKIWELNKEAAEREHERSDGTILEVSKAAVTNAETVIRTLILINGGAAISIMTFVGSLAAKPGAPTTQIAAIAKGLEWFAIGTLAATLTACFAYLSNFLYVSAEQKRARDYTHPFLHETESASRLLSWAKLCHGLAVATVILSLTGFGGGIWFVSGGVAAISAPTSK